MWFVMVGERTKEEFERAGVEAVRQQVEQGAYWEGKKQTGYQVAQSARSPVEKRRRPQGALNTRAPHCT